MRKNSLGFLPKVKLFIVKFGELNKTLYICSRENKKEVINIIL